MRRRDFIFKGLIWVPTGILAARSLEAAQQFLPSRRKAFQPVGGGGGDNIAFRSKNQAIGNGNGATVGEPAGAAADDVMVALAICDQASSSLGIPAGWTSIYSGNASTLFRYNLAYIRRGGSAPSLTWTMSTSTYREVHILCYSGVVNSGSPIDVSADGGVVNPATNPDCPSATTGTANAMALACAVHWSGSGGGGWTAPTGYTRRTDNTAGNDVVISDKKVVSAGAENPSAYSGSGGNNCTWSATIALKD